MGVGFILGVLSGLLSSIAFWFVMTKVIVPKIEFEDELRREIDGNGNPVYKVAFKNVGRVDVIDLKIIVRIRIKDPNKDKSYLILSIPTDHSESPELEKRITKIYTLLFNKSNDLLNCRYATSTLIGKANNNTLELDDIRTCLKGTDYTIEVFVFGYDKFSGARKLFKEKYR